MASNVESAGKRLLHRLVRVVLPALLMAAAAAVSARAQTAEEVLERVREKYASIRDARISFTRRTTFAMTTVEQTSPGTLLLKKENRYRVDLDRHTIVTDGVTVWSFSAPTNQVLIDHFKPDARGITPERLLTGAPGDLSATLLARETVAGRETIGLKLVPRARGTAAGTVRLWVDPKTWLVRKVSLGEEQGKETTYTVSDISINPGIDDGEFAYRIPEGADVVDLR